jgi:peptide/nickel transport system permease protein
MSAPSFARGLCSRPWLALGCALALLMTLLALFAPVLARHNPTEHVVSSALPVPPSAQLPLGTDSSQRDLWSRLLYGARNSLSISLGATVLATVLGLLVGVAAGYGGGVLDAVLMRATDVVMAFPAVLLALALGAVLPYRNLLTLILILGLVNWTAAARIFRSETLTLRERLYVEATRALGGGHRLILARHVLPHLAPTVLFVASMSAATTILLDAGLSFLGVGLPDPAPTWGSALKDAQSFYSVAPWLAIWPGVAVLVSVAAFNLIAFDLRRQLARRR